MLNTWSLKWLGKKWNDIHNEVSEFAGDIVVHITFPPGKESQTGDLRVARIKKDNDKLNFVLTRDKF